MCPQCVEAAAARGQDATASPPQCEACSPRRAAGTVALRRDRIVWGELLGFAFALYKRHFVQVTTAMLLALSPFALAQAASYALSSLFGGDDFLLAIALSLLLGVAQLLAQAVTMLSALDLCLRLARGQTGASVSLRAGLSRLGPLLLQYLMVNFALAFASLCAAAPVIAVFAFSGGDPPFSTLGIAALVALCGAAFVFYTMLGFSFAPFELMAQPRLDALAALRNAWAIARGERLTIFVGMAIATLLALAGVASCFVGLIFTLGYALLVLGVLYTALRNGAELPA